jgi:hypothetical protein
MSDLKGLYREIHYTFVFPQALLYLGRPPTCRDEEAILKGSGNPCTFQEGSVIGFSCHNLDTIRFVIDLIQWRGKKLQ